VFVSVLIWGLSGGRPGHINCVRWGHVAASVPGGPPRDPEEDPQPRLAARKSFCPLCGMPSLG